MSEEVISTEAPAAVETVTPTEQVQTPESTAQTSGTEQTEVAEKPKDSAPKSDWVQRRIDQLTREKHEAHRRAEEAEARARQFETHQPTETPSGSVPRAEIEKAAAQLIKQREFDSACNSVFEAGKKEFPDFDSSLKTFQMLGGAPVEFLEAVTSLDNGHKVLHHLGANPEAAERLLGMSPLKMALELARLETTLNQAKPVSKAPAPITPVGGKASPVEPDEFKSTAEYIAWRKKKSS
jgi:hypothetical protein